MSTQKEYYVNQYQASLDASVLSCTQTEKGWEILLDRTIFFPTGGGQPCDLGRIGEAEVLDVFERGEDVVHLCGSPLTVGSTVSCEIDWARRFMLMQQHSGEHIVSGIVHRRFGYDNVGFHMGKDAITIDFSGELSAEELREVERAANEAIWRDLPVTAYYPDAETLKTLHYRSKKELTGPVRLVRLEGTDLCACCGTHVAHIGEVGLIKILSNTRFHGGSRIELLCGSRAWDWVTAIYEQNRQISGLLSAKMPETADAVQHLTRELAAAQYRCVELENHLFAQKAEALSDRESILLFENVMTPEALRRLTDALMQKCSGRCAVFAGNDGDYKYAIGQAEGDMRPLARRLNENFSGRGGGKPGFVQGSVKASRSELESFFSAIENR